MKLPFPSLLTPTTKILLTPTTNLTLLFYFFFLFYLTKSHLFSTSSPTFLSLHFLFFDLFLCLSCLALVSLFSNGSSKLSKAVVTTASIWVWVWVDGFFVESLILGSKLLSFPLKVWFWVWIDFGFGLILGLDWFLVWFFFVFGWFCDWNIMGCDGLSGGLRLFLGWVSWWVWLILG